MERSTKRLVESRKWVEVAAAVREVVGRRSQGGGGGSTGDDIIHLSYAVERMKLGRQSRGERETERTPAKKKMGGFCSWRLETSLPPSAHGGPKKTQQNRVSFPECVGSSLCS